MVFFFFFIGLFVGSFLNVIVLRLPKGESFVSGRSRCPSCRKPIAWYDNLPLIGFIRLRGRCRSCRAAISWHYPLAEVVTGSAFALVAWAFGTAGFGTVLLWIVVTACLIVVLFYDAKHLEIPMRFVWISIAVAFLLTLLHDATRGMSVWSPSSQTMEGVLSGICAFGFFWLLAAYSQETWMGKGDAYLGFILGLLLGWPGVFVALLSAFCTGALYGIILLALSRGTMRSQVPFGPFLIIGLYVAVVVGRLSPDFFSIFL